MKQILVAAALIAALIAAAWFATRTCKPGEARIAIGEVMLLGGCK